MGGDIEEVPRAACDEGRSSYCDPATGLTVFTEVFLKKRGKCCGSGCRHCPYRPAPKSHAPARVIWGDLKDLTSEVDVLFWSGGKDSFVAFLRMQRLAVRDIVLLTTFDNETGVVAHQEVSILQIEQQARAVAAPLVGVPLQGESYTDRVLDGLNLVRDNGHRRIARLCFGDLHLEHIRQWREVHLEVGIPLEFPLWKVPYDELKKELNASGATVRVSAVDHTLDVGLRVGDLFDPALVGAQFDSFGENGEFHTLVEIGDAKLDQK